MWLWEQYLSNVTQADDQYASPLRAPALTNLPAALVITAEYDILRDEGWRYAERLSQAGAPVTHRHYANAIHGFFSMPGLFPEGPAAMTEASNWLKERFSAALAGDLGAGTTGRPHQASSCGAGTR